MSHNIRSSRSSPRFSPYPASHTPAAVRLSPLSPSSGQYAARTSSENYLSPAPAYYQSLTPYPFVPPIQNHQPIPAAQLFTTCQHWMDQDYSVSQRPTRQDHGALPSYSVGQQPLKLPQEESSLQGATFYGEDMFNDACQFSINNGTFIDHGSNDFMEKFLQCTIIGAEVDSSDRHPPPRCHPGTRLAIIHRCLDFIVQCSDKEKLRWIVGPAGVGKTAVMQIVAEETPANVVLGASIFLSTNGRKNGTKIITTIAYQLAVNCAPYRRFLERETTRDPSLHQKSLPAQFKKFISEPFILRNLFGSSHRYVVIIDGLDECDNPHLQRELLELISSFCLGNPKSPIVWIVASRPEPHITSFFEDNKYSSVYAKEEMMIDSDEACEDAQLYLRDELTKIKLADPTLEHKQEWPSQLEFTKIATAAGGLFAYASTVIRYIGDDVYGDPVAQLHDVLVAIDAGPKEGISGKNHPMAQLDALYERILSKIPDGVKKNTRKLLLLYSNHGWFEMSFRVQCNVLGLTESAAYSAVRYVHSVLKVPKPVDADNERLEYFHKSFRDYVFDFERSGFCQNINDEAEQIMAQSWLRIYEELPHVSDDSGSDHDADIYCAHFGHVKCGPGFCDNISLSWPGDKRFEMTDDLLQRELYCGAITMIRSEFSPSSIAFGNMSSFRALTTLITSLDSEIANFADFYKLQCSVFDKFRSELTCLGELKQVPLSTLDYASICGPIELRFTSPIETNIKLSDPWNLACTQYHDKMEIDCVPLWRGWSTRFETFSDMDSGKRKATHSECFANDEWLLCDYCSRRFAHYLMDNPDHLVTVFVDSTQMCYVEMTIDDPDDGVSQWRYRFFHSGPPTCIDV